MKSGYKSLMETTRYCQTSNFCCIENLLDWKLNVPGKIKHFLWKSCTNSLPSKENLMKRAIPIDSICHLCSRDNESVLHALWGSEKVQKVWATNFGWVDRNKASSGSFSNLVQLIQEKPHIVSLFSITAWSIWHHRNKSRL